MGNQYATASFGEAMQSKYDKKIQEVLLDFQKSGYSYKKVVELTGFKDSTIRKWCRKYNVILSKEGEQRKDKVYYDQMLTKIKVNGITVDNVLYKNWMR